MIGSHLTDELLKRGYHIIGMDNYSYGRLENIQHNFQNKKFEFHQQDILDVTSLQRLCKDVDTIIHLAAVKKISDKETSLPTLSVNAKGTENIFEAARTCGCKVLFASTSDVYGTSPDLPLNENGDLLIGPSMIKRWSYAVSKLYGEQLAFGYYHDYKVPMVIIRYFGGFSPRSSFKWSGGHVPIFIRAILDDDTILIHGDGSQTRSMGFVTDLVQGTILALENPQAVGEVFNIGNDEELSVLDTAKLIHRIADTGRELKIQLIPMSDIFGKYKDIMRRKPDISKAKKILGYEPIVKLENAIRVTIEHIKANK